MSDVVLNANLNYTWNGEVPREVFLDPTVQTPDIQNLFTIQQRVKSKWQIHTAAALNKVTKADDGCGLSDTPHYIRCGKQPNHPIEILCKKPHLQLAALQPDLRTPIARHRPGDDDGAEKQARDAENHQSLAA